MFVLMTDTDLKTRLVHTTCTVKTLEGLWEGPVGLAAPRAWTQDRRSGKLKEKFREGQASRTGDITQNLCQPLGLGAFGCARIRRGARSRYVRIHTDR